METDIQYYKIFQAVPEWVFELTGIASPGKCEFRSEEIKALRRRTDGLVVPEDDFASLTVAELQFRNDAAIYNRVVEEMSIIQRNHGLRDIRGIVIFADEELDPKTEPWTEIVRAFYLPDLLANLRKRQPDHPLLSLFAPLTEDPKRLEADAPKHYRKIEQSDFPVAVIGTLIDVFVSWLEQRFTSKTKKEIEAMLLGELPDLRETRSGQDLIDIGRKEGKKDGALHARREILIRLLERRFGKLDATTKRQIRAMTSSRKLNSLVLQAGTVESLDEMSW